MARCARRRRPTAIVFDRSAVVCARRRRPTANRCAVVCADGSPGETSFKKYGGSFPSGPTPLDVPFGVAKGARPKTLTIGELTFDVEGFPVETSSGS